MVDEFILFIFDQSLLECQQPPVSFKSEHIYDGIEVKPRIPPAPSVLQVPGFYN